MLYYYPNRPHEDVADPYAKDHKDPSPDHLNSLEQSGKYIAEQKWNGDNVQIFTDTLQFWNRQKKLLTRYRMTPEVKAELEQWPKGCMLNAELVHNHTTTVKNLIIVHCIMVWKGKPLIGKTWGDSRDLLEEVVQQGLSGEHVQVSKIWDRGFFDLYQSADGSIIEGIILKNPNGRLVFSATPIKDVPWMRKFRKPCKKYNY